MRCHNFVIRCQEAGENNELLKIMSVTTVDEKEVSMSCPNFPKVEHFISNGLKSYTRDLETTIT